jgi:hypothetical protein
MKTSESYQPASNLAILLVGVPKSGKTCVSAAFPNPFFLDVDLNLDSAVRVMKDKKFWYSQPPLEEADPSKVYAYSMDKLKEAALSPDVQTIVVDGLTKLADFACAHILAEVSRMEGKKIASMRIQDFGRFMSLFQRLISFLRSSGKLVICTSHQTSSKDDITGAMHYALSIPGQLKDTFGGFFTDVWATTATAIAGDKTKYEIRTRPTGFHVALGTSIRTLEPALDITNKTPDEIWSLLSPRLSISATSLSQKNQTTKQNNTQLT